jgi:hypothetical protein
MFENEDYFERVVELSRIGLNSKWLTASHPCGIST